MRIFDQLRNNADYTVAENAIAKYVLDNAREAVGLSLDDFSKKLFVSKSTVIRFCKKLGFKGHKEFIVELARELDSFLYKDILIDASNPYVYSDDRNAIAQKTYTLIQGALDETWQDLEMPKLMSLARSIHDNSFVIYASEDMYLQAMDFAYKLRKLNVRIESVCMPETNVKRAVRQKEGCALFLTYEGNQTDLLKSAKLLQDNHVRIYLIVGPDRSPLLHMASGTIQITYYEPQPKQVNCGSVISFELIFSIIYAYIYIMDYETNNINIHKQLNGD